MWSLTSYEGVRYLILVLSGMVSFYFTYDTVPLNQNSEVLAILCQTKKYLKLFDIIVCLFVCLFVFMGPGNPVMGHPIFQGFSLKPKRYREGSLSSTGVNRGYEQTNS